MMKRTCLFLLVSVLGFGLTPVQGKKKVTKKKVAEVAKVDTVSLSTFSYAMGMAQTEGLSMYLTQRMNVDTAYMADFLRGLQEMMAAPSDKKMAAYAAGLQIGQQVMGQILPNVNKQITDDENASFVQEDRFKQGFLDGLMKKQDVLTTDSAAAIVNKQMAYYIEALTEKKYGDNRRAGEEFLVANAKKDSVKTLPGSTVQYKVLTKGTGAVPAATDRVKVNYEGRLLDGTVFDSSYKRNEPATFACNQVIQGWTEALTQMPVGSVWEVYIPQDKAYGTRQAGKIPPYSMLIFKIELLEIVK